MNVGYTSDRERYLMTHEESPRIKTLLSLRVRVSMKTCYFLVDEHVSDVVQMFPLVFGVSY